MRGRHIRCESLPAHPDFVALASLSDIRVDLRYASENNVFGRNVYAGLDCAWLHVDAGAAVRRVVAWLRENSTDERLLVLDALRPHRIQRALWEGMEGTPLQRYLADPARGSIHSYGLALDATLVDCFGREVDMGTAFDTMTELSHPEFEDRHLASGELSQVQIGNRRRLRAALHAGGFQSVSHEWWHFDLHNRDVVREHGLRVE